MREGGREERRVAPPIATVLTAADFLGKDIAYQTWAGCCYVAMSIKLY